jgi:uncharacterized protein (DUF433 family)
MTFAVQAEVPPVREDPQGGALRVGNSRVLLELVIDAFDDGATPESIVSMYSTLALADVYAVIAYYLNHRSQVKAYLETREREAKDMEQRMGARNGDMADIRARLEARRQR